MTGYSTRINRLSRHHSYPFLLAVSVPAAILIYFVETQHSYTDFIQFIKQQSSIYFLCEENNYFVIALYYKLHCVAVCCGLLR